ncbi:MAG: four helix bundle protein, partial [Thermovirgaceae bacterium]|nr:four helix bundle protein [Thermovirgaceae bacterium]
PQGKTEKKILLLFHTLQMKLAHNLVGGSVKMADNSVGQLRRSAVSVPSNIAEGACRGSKKDFIRFLMIARGSLGEIETQSYLAKDLGYLEGLDEIINLTNRVFRLICGLISSLNTVKS